MEGWPVGELADGAGEHAEVAGVLPGGARPVVFAPAGHEALEVETGELVGPLAAAELRELGGYAATGAVTASGLGLGPRLRDLRDAAEARAFFLATAAR